jgi:hypothetical protein
VMADFQHNTFRALDAVEYVDAYRWAINADQDELDLRMKALSDRMGSNPASYLLAAYRGYESALLFRQRGIPTTIVKLNDLDPTPV